jgi:hypothetical protein
MLMKNLRAVAIDKVESYSSFEEAVAAARPPDVLPMSKKIDGLTAKQFLWSLQSMFVQFHEGLVLEVSAGPEKLACHLMEASECHHWTEASETPEPIRLIFPTDSQGDRDERIVDRHAIASEFVGAAIRCIEVEARQSWVLRFRRQLVHMGLCMLLDLDAGVPVLMPYRDDRDWWIQRYTAGQNLSGGGDS